MSYKAIEHFAKYPLKWSELEPLTEDQKAFISLVSLAITEINNLMKLYIYSNHLPTDEDAINIAIHNQRMIILRTWSSKLFEAVKLFEGKASYHRSQDEKVNKLRDDAIQQFQKIEESGKKIAQFLRNEVASHYSMNAAKKNLQFVDQLADVSFYIHQNTGNCFYPMGEEVMFLARIKRGWENDDDELDLREFEKQWWSWNLEASRWLQTTFANISNELIFKQFDQKFTQKKSYWINPEFVGNLDTDKVPLFHRTEEPTS